VTSWVRSWTWGSPIYYDYGYGGNVYYEDNTVYVDGQAACTGEAYAQQASQIAQTIPQVDPEQVEWMPLGVFALTQDEGAESNMFIQLAVSQEGIIAGSYENTTSGAVQSLEGSVDAESQRAAWTVVDKNTPVMETGIYNLTQDQTPALVHFADGQTQQWLLVRMDPPEESAAAE